MKCSIRGSPWAEPWGMKSDRVWEQAMGSLCAGCCRSIAPQGGFCRPGCWGSYGLCALSKGTMWRLLSERLLRLLWCRPWRWGCCLLRPWWLDGRLLSRLISSGQYILRCGFSLMGCFLILTSNPSLNPLSTVSSENLTIWGGLDWDLLLLRAGAWTKEAGRPSECGERSPPDVPPLIANVTSSSSPFSMLRLSELALWWRWDELKVPMLLIFSQSSVTEGSCMARV